ncbi:MAG: hypothetical protein IKP81_06400 [Paludibacteraceae bacterium]|nr:hypothetical protein [Paludibacteraceae bacterium]
MVDENLLATYALLSFIRDSKKGEDKECIIHLFTPIVCDTLNKIVARHNGKDVSGRDYTEIKEMILREYQIDIPIPILSNILPNVNQLAEGIFTIYSDHSFVIKANCNFSLQEKYDEKKQEISSLSEDYRNYCNAKKVKYDFDELIDFIQDQKNRIFEGKESVVEGQGYYVSKYINHKIQKKDKYFDIICSIYLGGLISSYLNFKIKEKIVDTELLIDTNFYISLLNLNTPEAYDTCKCLYDLTIQLGYRYSILEKTIYQIQILLNSRINRFEERDLLATIDKADILAACIRRNIGKTDLEAIKDNIYKDLNEKSIGIIYTSSIRNLVESTEKSSELKTLAKIRSNRDSALNDLIAKSYVEYRRKDKAISEFSDVNCWFLNNSYSINKQEISKPLWLRKSITASDLLVLLWLANPSQKQFLGKSHLAITSLSANVIKYRSNKLPSHKIIEKLQTKVVKLQEQGIISTKTIANLCIRMSEGLVDENEAERLLTLSTTDFADFVEKINKEEESYLETKSENEELKRNNLNLEADLLDIKIENKIIKRRLSSVLYIFIIIAVYIFGVKFVPTDINDELGYVISLLYWLLTTVIVNWVNHWYFLDGLVSFVNKKRIKEKIKNELSK